MERNIVGLNGYHDYWEQISVEWMQWPATALVLRHNGNMLYSFEDHRNVKYGRLLVLCRYFLVAPPPPLVRIYMRYCSLIVICNDFIDHDIHFRPFEPYGMD